MTGQYHRIVGVCIGHWAAGRFDVLEVGLTKEHRLELAEELMEGVPPGFGFGLANGEVTYVDNPATGGHVTIAPAVDGEEYATVRVPLVSTTEREQ